MNFDFIIEGVIPATADSPCFCTPIFRAASGERFFTQVSDQFGRITEFQFAGNIPRERYHHCLLNEPVKINDNYKVGFLFADGTLLVDSEKKLFRILELRIKEFKNYPFLFLQIAKRSKKNSLIKKALRLPEVKEAISRKWIQHPFPKNANDKTRANSFRPELKFSSEIEKMVSESFNYRERKIIRSKRELDELMSNMRESFTNEELEAALKTFNARNK